jgi:phosphoribosylformylglycinamidine synthase
MKAGDISFCILRGPGTNCDIETREALEHFGCKVEIVHINRFVRGERDITGFQGLVVPGGFSYGDRVRSGAIMGKILGEKFGRQVAQMAEEGKPILGICNGFQVLVESGILPGITRRQEVALGTNTSSRFEDRWVYLRNESRGTCIFTKGLKKLTRMPVAHAEGKLILPLGEERGYLRRLEENDQIVFCYATQDGDLARGRYPENPNSSIADIAGICDPSGVVLGMMPHPERAFHRIMYPDWTRKGLEDGGDGYVIFKNMVDYVRKRF